MSYSIKWHPQAYRVLKKLPKHLIKRVLDKLDFISKDPFRFLEHFEGENYYKLRIGNYRVLIEIELKELILLVKVFDHRSKIYNR